MRWFSRVSRGRRADLGYVLNRAYWNRGFVTEATRAILDVAFSVLKLHRVIATCDTRNGASARVMEKAGMRRDTTRFKKASGAIGTCTPS